MLNESRREFMMHVVGGAVVAGTVGAMPKLLGAAGPQKNAMLPTPAAPPPPDTREPEQVWKDDMEARIAYITANAVCTDEWYRRRVIWVNSYEYDHALSSLRRQGYMLKEVKIDGYGIAHVMPNGNILAVFPS